VLLKIIKLSLIIVRWVLILTVVRHKKLFLFEYQGKCKMPLNHLFYY